MKNSASGPNTTVSPHPVCLRYASARLAIERGSRSYISPVDGSSTSQKIAIVVCAKKGSMWALLGSGINVMSDASMPFQPAIEEPSKAYPSANIPSLTHEPSAVTCCILPLVSVKRRSRNLTSLSFIIFKTSPTDFGLSAIATPLSSLNGFCSSPGRLSGHRAKQSNRVRPGFSGTNANCLFDGRDENLAVANAARLGGLLDRLEGLAQHVVGQHDLDLDLGQEVDDVLRTTIKLGVALLSAKALGLDHGDALQANFLQRLLHLVELEGLDNRFDFLHAFPAAPKGPCSSLASRLMALAQRVPRITLAQISRQRTTCAYLQGNLIPRQP